MASAFPRRESHRIHLCLQVISKRNYINIIIIIKIIIRRRLVARLRGVKKERPRYTRVRDYDEAFIIVYK